MRSRLTVQGGLAPPAEAQERTAYFDTFDQAKTEAFNLAQLWADNGASGKLFVEEIGDGHRRRMTLDLSLEGID